MSAIKPGYKDQYESEAYNQTTIKKTDPDDVDASDVYGNDMHSYKSQHKSFMFYAMVTMICFMIFAGVVVCGY